MRGSLVEDYLDEVRRVVPGSRRRRRRLLRELDDHIADFAAEYGGTGDAAVTAALRRLGAPAQVAMSVEAQSWVVPPAIVMSSSTPPVETTVHCSGALHTVRLVRGAIVLVDHDARAEETLAALGGPVPECLEVLRAWRQPYEDAIALVPTWLEPSAPAPDLRAERGARYSTAARLFRSAFPELASALESTTRRRRAVISSLPPPFRAAFVAGVLRAAERRVARDPTQADALRAVARALTWRAVRAVTAGPIPTRVSVDGLSSVPKVAVDGDGLTVTVGLTWPRVVAAAGLSVVDGRLVLGVDEPTAHRGRVTLLDWHITRNRRHPIARPATLMASPSLGRGQSGGLQNTVE